MTLTELIKKLVEEYKFTQEQVDNNSICCDGSIDRLKDLIGFSVFINYGWDKATYSLKVPTIGVYANPLVDGYYEGDSFIGTPEEILNWILNYEPTKLKKIRVKFPMRKKFFTPLLSIFLWGRLLKL